MAPKHRLYTPEIAETILEQLQDGMSLVQICAADGMPSRGAVQWWVTNDHDGFASRYARARETGLALLEDDLLSIADDGRNDTYVVDGEERTNHDVVNRSKLRLDARKWLLSKRMPKVFGDRVAMEHSGEVAISAVPDDQLKARAELLLKQAQGAE
jgi:hypothetical protein